MKHAWRLTPPHAVVLLGVVALAAGLFTWLPRLIRPAAPVATAKRAPAAAASGGSAAPVLAGWFASGPVRVDVAVTGLIHSRGRAVALLAVNGAPPAVFQAGDAVSGAVSVDAVEADAVVLRRDQELIRVAASLPPAPPDRGLMRVR